MSGPINTNEHRTHVQKQAAEFQMPGGTMKQAKAIPVQAFVVGEEIEARWKNKRYYHAGVIKSCNKDGTYDVDYDDDDEETSVAERLIRTRHRTQTKPVEYSSGRIAASGPISTSKSQTHVQKQAAQFQMPSGPVAHAVASPVQAFVIGEEIEAKWNNKRHYHAGVIKSCNKDGTYDVAYDDGDEEASVAERLIRTRSRSHI